MSRAVIKTEETKSTLSVIGATKDDSGEFTCQANNGVGEAATKIAKLIVKCKLVL